MNDRRKFLGAIGLGGLFGIADGARVLAKTDNVESIPLKQDNKYEEVRVVSNITLGPNGIEIEYSNILVVNSKVDKNISIIKTEDCNDPIESGV